jgi:hypothetical protein
MNDNDPESQLQIKRVQTCICLIIMNLLGIAVCVFFMFNLQLIPNIFLFLITAYTIIFFFGSIGIYIHLMQIRREMRYEEYREALIPEVELDDRTDKWYHEI